MLAAPEASIHRLILWNIDLTLVDVARVSVIVSCAFQARDHARSRSLGRRGRR